LFLFFIFFLVSTVFSQETESKEHSDFWLCAGAETAFYGISKLAYGGSIALGYGSGSSIGIKAAYLYNTEGFTVIEFNFLLRWYFLGRTSADGLFIQFGGGPVFFTEGNTPFNASAHTASMSVGLDLGWRILLGRRFFLEPSVRAGYPFFIGAGLSAGLNL
jgi:hypothetical protein